MEDGVEFLARLHWFSGERCDGLDFGIKNRLIEDFRTGSTGGTRDEDVHPAQEPGCEPALQLNPATVCSLIFSANRLW